MTKTLFIELSVPMGTEVRTIVNNTSDQVAIKLSQGGSTLHAVSMTLPQQKSHNSTPQGNDTWKDRGECYYTYKDNDGQHNIRQDDIKYIKGARDSCIVYLDNGKKEVLITKPMKEVLGALRNKEFVRVHRSFAVNTKHVSCRKGNRIYIGDQAIPIGREYRNKNIVIGI